jgi:diguanylate cyclase (GGDEF)-like protein
VLIQNSTSQLRVHSVGIYRWLRTRLSHLSGQAVTPDWHVLRAVSAPHALIAVLTLTIGAIGIDYVKNRELNQLHARTAVDIERLAHLLAGHAEIAFAEADEALKSYKRAIEAELTLGTNDLTFENKQFSIRNHSPLARLGHADEHGIIKQSTAGLLNERISILGRPHFDYHTSTVDKRRYISAPTRAKIAGEWTIYISRRIDKKDGTFGGVGIAAISPERLAAMYSNVLTNSKATARLVSSDGVVFAASGAQRSQIGNSLFQGEALGQLELLQARTAWTTLADRDVELFTARRLEGLPYYVVAGYPSGAFEADLKQETEFFNQLIYLIAIILFAITIGTVFVRYHSMIAHRQLDVSKTKETELLNAIRIQSARFKTTIENMPVGVCMYDDAGVAVVCNLRFTKMYNLPTDLVQRGLTYKQIVELRELQNLYILPAENDSQLQLAEQWNNHHKIKSARLDSLTDGRFIRVVRSPLDEGGWVALHDDVTIKRRNAARIVDLALRDSLTTLANRAAFCDALDAAAQLSTTEPFALFVLDIDHFKWVNDSLGHPFGDKVLIAVANRLKEAMRATDLIARLGGDEFAVIAPGIDSAKAAELVADRLLQTLRKPHSIDGQELTVECSVGIALSQASGDSRERLLQAADIALYQAKNSSRNTARCFESGMIELAQERRRLESELREALVLGQFEPHYQPIVEAKSGKTCGFEALIRWRHPERGLVPPLAFIPIAEKTGLVSEIGHWMLSRALADLALLPSPMKISVNVSPYQLKKKSFYSEVVEAVVNSKISPNRLVFEVTEAVFLSDDKTTFDTLVKLRELGIVVAMDDFGTGFSSLGYLRRFPFDALKIDRTFVADIDTSAQSKSIVKAIVELARGLNMRVTAEGVETAAQRQCVVELGCDHIQGYYFGKPRSASEAFAEFIDGGRVAQVG